MCGANSVEGSKTADLIGSSPRVRGEQGWFWDFTALPGSSPRVRGEPTARTGRQKRRRIIPACAGRTKGLRRGLSALPDHPRVCGANQHPRPQQPAGAGSSPRVRGEQDRHRPRQLPRRIIPACAGRTRSASLLMASLPDHPRVCGANQTHDQRIRAEAGSSPRVRGEPDKRINAIIGVRIIPACAGRTPSPSVLSVDNSDHPRVCGANL